MQGDGNLFYYRTSDWTPRWNSQTQSPGAFAPMQGDGNLVVYASGGAALWNYLAERRVPLRKNVFEYSIVKCVRDRTQV
jgi:hypothetical protein